MYFVYYLFAIRGIVNAFELKISVFFLILLLLSCKTKHTQDENRRELLAGETQYFPPSSEDPLVYGVHE